jgi:hypothetical protein
MDFKTITDIIFTKKRLWPEVTDDEKESLYTAPDGCDAGRDASDIGRLQWH